MIEDYMQNLTATRNGLSAACLAERGEISATSPYGFDIAKPISCDEPVVICLTGEGSPGKNYKNYNGYLKRVDEYIQEISESLARPVRSVVAIIDYGKYHNPQSARTLDALRHQSARKYQKELQSLPCISRQEYAEPQYIADIFNAVFIDRIATNNGTQKLSAKHAACNIRKVQIITHCHGAYVALKLEEFLTKKMAELGYAKHEQEKILKQLLVLSYAPDCILGTSKAETVSFSSAMDYNSTHGGQLKDYLQQYDFGVAFFPNKMGNVFYCTQIDKRGIEGNPPPVLVSVDPDEWFKDFHKDKDTSDDTSHLGEHEFPGFRKYDNMSKGALQMMTYMRRIFKNALIHACKQKEEDFTPLPSISALAAENSSQHKVFLRAKYWGYRLWADMKIKTKFLHRNFVQPIKQIILD